MILVTGAGGTVGKEVVKRLRADGIPFRAAYRSQQKRRQAADDGIDAVAVELGRSETLRPALAGVDALFLLAGNDPSQADLEINAVREARRAGVKKLVKLSVWGASADSHAFARIHRVVEREIESSGLAWTLLRPNSFMQNLATYMAPTIRARGCFYVSAAGARISHIDVRDIASVASVALTREGHTAKAYDLSGPEPLTYLQIAEKLSTALGRRIACVDLPPADFRAGMLGAGAPEWLADAMVDLTRYFAAGEAQRVTPAVREVTGRDPIPFDRFLADHVEAFV